jgi:hypothetical protein
MALNFPSLPTLNQPYSNEGITWKWNGVAWDLVDNTADYNNLINTPVIPAAQVQVNWNAVSGISSILNKPTLAAVATTGNYGDLIGAPAAFTYTLPTASTLVLGGVKVDGSTIEINNGVITAVASGLPTYNINGVPFNATQDITINAESSTLTGSVLAPTVVSSSLTSVGTLTNLTVAGNITAQTNVNTTGTVSAAAITATTASVTTATLGTATVTNNLTANANVIISTLPTAKTHATNKSYVDVRSVAMAVALA